MTKNELRDRVFSLLPHVTEVNPSDNFIELTHRGTVLIDSYKEDIDQAVESLKKAKKKLEEDK